MPTRPEMAGIHRNFRKFSAFFAYFLEKMLAIPQAIVVLYFSIPHGASTFCLCPGPNGAGLAGGMKPPEVKN